MATQISSIASRGFLERLRTAGIEPGDSEELRLSKSLLMLATGLVCAAMMVWLAIYTLLGLRFSTDIPMLFLLLLAGNMFLFIGTHRFDFFRVTQLGLFLFLPYVAQWASGNLIVSSGIVLWGLLAPIGAILCIGARESMGWFIAWVVLTALSGGVDYYLADSLISRSSVVPIHASLLFFTLNFICVAAISYALLLYSIEERRRAQERMELARQQLQVANDAAENLVRGPVIFI
jgi:adenylate cyclase